MRIVVIGDIHVQIQKFWLMLEEAGLTDASRKPTFRLKSADTKLVFLGDLVHPKSRDHYAHLIGVPRFDEFNPEHIAKAEMAQELFLREVKAFYDSVPSGAITILMGNHDFNAVHMDQGPLRTDDVAHLEWKEKNRLPKVIRDWILTWPLETTIEGIHFAHVGPLKEHNTYDNSFYLENRRRWIYEDQDFLANTPYRLGVYGHTPVRGGVNIASQGRAILLDTNGHEEEYSFLDIQVNKDRYRLKMRGVFFDEFIQR
jgi:Calcineurin-like phosphoesterase